MTEIARTYLGNIKKNPTLAEKLQTSEAYLEVNLSQSDRGKGRIYTQSTSGIAIGIIKSRDWLLKEGDILETEGGNLILVHIQPQELMVLSFKETAVKDAIDLIHLGHVLGNHHYPILVRDNKIYLQLIVNKERIEATIRSFNIPGLHIDYQEEFDGDLFNFSQDHH